jgi:hypothetical protein
MTSHLKRSQHKRNIALGWSIFVIGCAIPARSQTTVAQVTSTTSPEIIAKLAWKALSTQCPESAPSLFYVINESAPRDADGTRRVNAPSYWKLIEYNHVSFFLPKADEISEADTANGIQWQGRASLRVGIYRYIQSRLPSRSDDILDPQDVDRVA